jgi:SAM-dependent MidA family methyltransferase
VSGPSGSEQGQTGTRDDSDATTPALLEIIRDEIRECGEISFARFMELALYHETYGYYTGGGKRLGRQGDYITSSDAGKGFGRAIAHQLIDVDQKLGPFDPFHVLEFGAGRGLLARHTLDALAELDPELLARLQYLMVDRSAGMRETARELVPEARVIAPDQLEGGYRGCVVAVELFDALPVHRLRRRDGELVEVMVTLDDAGELVERETSPGAQLVEWAERYGIALEEDIEAELAPSITQQLDLMADQLERGVLIVVDYGYTAERLYSPERGRGTLLAYHRNRTNEEYLKRVGEQDLTAHVNFSALMDRAHERGLDVLGLTTQDRFLISNGILEYFEQNEQKDWQDPQRTKARLAAMQLIHPSGMGRIFKVLLMACGCTERPELRGVSDPFERS